MTSPDTWSGAGLPGFADTLAGALGQDASDRVAMDRFTREALTCVPGDGRPVAGIGLNGGSVDWRFRGNFVEALGKRGRVFARTDEGFAFVAFRDLAVTTRLEVGRTVVTPVKRVSPSGWEPSVEDYADQANDAWLGEAAVALRRAGEREETATRVLRTRILDVMAAAPEGTLIRAKMNHPCHRMETGSLTKLKGIEGRT